MPQRAVLGLGKYTVVEVFDDGFRVRMGGTTEMRVQVPREQMWLYDVRPGDVLTYYTEVLFKQPKGQ